MKAIALFSGGLDSVLAAKIILNQGIKVVAVSFVTPFSTPEFKNRVKLLATALNIDLKLVDIGKEFLEILKSPRHGYGRNLNPCIDCRILQLKTAHELMKKSGASFIVTGEVLGQRPMSQNGRTMELIKRESGIEGLVVRPLSAKLLAPSIPEKENWIKREELFGIAGRSRKEQLKLAEKYNISGYGAPAGGCLLTDPGFSLKAKDLLRSHMLDSDSIGLIKTGRYFNISDSFKLMVGRNQKENLRLTELAKKGDMVFEPEAKGPIAIGRGKREDKNTEIASRIVAYYCKPIPPARLNKDGDCEVSINIRIFPRAGEEKVTVNIKKISEEELISYLIHTA